MIGTQDRRAWLRAALDRQPRVRLAALPTPLELLPRLTAELGGPKLYVKRDDLTGLAFGGNKTRALEYVLGDLLTQRPEVLVTGANIQSNWSRQAAAAAARLGIPIVLVLRNHEMQELQGNVLLDLWLGADVRFVDEPDVTAVIGQHLDRVVAELRAEGKRAFKIDPWAPSVALGYVEMMLELEAQCETMGIQPTRIWAAAAGPTQSGMVLGARLLNWPIRITGVAPIQWTNESMEDATARAGNAAAELLGTPVRISPSEIESQADYMAPGYGRPSPAGLDAMRLAARTDALLLDPVYTSKAMAGLIDHVRRGLLGRDDVVIFLHTGGLPAVFAYRDTVLEMATATTSAETTADV
jgi:L-cysteate sulfo-lyase